MARPTVIDVDEETRVPFLRGILTRSLQNAGLSFEASYRVANEIRDGLADVGEIDNVELRERVQAHLEERHPEVAERYATVHGPVEPIQVRAAGGEPEPYSRGRQRIDLMSAGLTPDEAAAIVSDVYRLLLERAEPEVRSDRLRELTRSRIRAAVGKKAAGRYMVWQRYKESDRPLLLLVGGTVGTGKSTISTELAHRLGIVRTQSTDMLREVMRAMIPRTLLPVLFESTYTAWKALPATEAHDEPTEAMLADGYLSQAEPVSIAYEAVVQRALQERVSLIMEGVHVHPGWVSRIPADADAIVVPIMLAVLKRKQLRKRIQGRGRMAPDRRAERYLSNFDSIWQLQSYLLSEADEAEIPIIFNDDKESTVQQSMAAVLRVLSTRLSGAAGGG